MPQPNIVFIHADQHRFDCVGANRQVSGGNHPFVQTPHLDRLAAEGANFIHAFTPCAVCVPARNCLLYGQWATQHGVIANWGSTDAHLTPPTDLPAFPRLLREQGYYLAHVGKWHEHPQDGPESFGFHTAVPDRRYFEWRTAQGLPSPPRANGWFGEVDPGITAEQSHPAWAADQVISLLEARAAAAEPFFIRWDLPEPHLPNVIPEPYASMYDPCEVPPWPSFPDPLDGKPYIQAQQLRSWKLDGWTWDRWAPTVARYLGELTLIDAQVGRILDALDRLGLAENTLVVYSTDHGDLCGGHGMIDKLYVMYDDIMRVPLIARWPAQVAPGTVVEDFVSHEIDLAASFCAAAGADIPATFSGCSLIPAMTRTGGTGREDIYATFHGAQFGLYSQRMVRDRRWKYVWNCTAEDELYDLAADPAELHNRAADPACADELARLRLRLVSWMEETKDALLNGWTRVQLLEGRKV